MLNSQLVDVRKYSYFVLVDSSVRGPFIPPYLPVSQASAECPIHKLLEDCHCLHCLDSLTGIQKTIYLTPGILTNCCRLVTTVPESLLSHLGTQVLTTNN